MELNQVFNSGFDDLEVGAEFSTYGRTVTESDLTAFSGLTGDHHPLHTDARWAAGSPFGERIAHGMLLLSYSVGLAPIDPDRVVALRGFDKVVFKRPVRIGDTITLSGKVDQVKPLDEETGLVRILWKVKNQEDALVLRAVVEIVWRRDADQGPGDSSAPAAATASTGTAPTEDAPAESNEKGSSAASAEPAEAGSTGTEPVYL